MNDALQLANSPIMWFFALLIVGAAITEAVLIFNLARKYIHQTNLLTREETMTCLKTGGVVSVGPALSIFVIALSMISMLGAPFTLMRIGMIGSASTELTAAGIGAEAAGVSLGMEPLTGTAFTAALWTCAFMSCGYLIFVPLVTRGIGKALNRVIVPAEGKKQSWLAWGLSALLPFLIFVALSYIQVSKSMIHLISLLIAAVLMILLNVLAGKLDKKWLRQWAMCFSVLGGIVVGGVLNVLL
ncbi:MAG: DUF5058 family protein [Solobacterium sp.]|jgi:hypothetical protein|nr:DUF5058 family protein [Solobacterium sp.]MCH4222340.1 DUF5058 family protein [Solobacterium sp.]MCH4265521.1 DUF5058 family protein [Solobacterium sp.]